MKWTIALLLLAATASADDWPGFLGPRRDGISRERNLASSWPAEGPRVLWKADVGEGYGGASIMAGRVYILDRVPGKQDVYRAFDLTTGRELWRYAYDAPGQVSYPGSKSTPTADEARLYGVGPYGHFHCLDKSDGRVLWTKNLLSDYGSQTPRYGFSQAPLLRGRAVIVAPQARQVGVTAFDRLTGEELWRSGPIGELGYGSPFLTTLDGVEQIVMLSQDQVTGLDPDSGRILWTRPNAPCRRRVTDPTPLGDGRFFLSGGYGAGSQMFRVQREGQAWKVVDLYHTDKAGSQCQHVILSDGLLYLNSNDKRGGLMCLDPDGTIRWQTGTKPSFDIGNVLLADGKLIALDGATGVLRLVAADPAGYKELAAAKLLDGKNLWAPMALSDGKLLLRDHKEIKCVDLRNP